MEIMNGCEMIPLSLNDRFRFSCSAQVPCFNACCKNLNQFVTPYDMLRLKKCLEVSSGEFLEKYTEQHFGPETGLPIITLKPDYSPDLKCPFVTSSGCSVYEDRPSSCRSYPLIRVASRSRETGEIWEQFMLLQESHCLGFQTEKTQTVREWIATQGIAIYNTMNDLMIEIIGLKKRLRPGVLNVKERYLFSLACYDLDRFRFHIFEKGLLDNLKLDADTLTTIQTDDVALLTLGIHWLKYIFFELNPDKPNVISC